MALHVYKSFHYYYQLAVASTQPRQSLMCSVLSISTNGQRKASVISLREIGYFPPKLKLLQEVSFKALVDIVGYSTQTGFLLQVLLKPLCVVLPSTCIIKHYFCLIKYSKCDHQVHVGHTL